MLWRRTYTHLILLLLQVSVKSLEPVLPQHFFFGSEQTGHVRDITAKSFSWRRGFRRELRPPTRPALDAQLFDDQSAVVAAGGLGAGQAPAAWDCAGLARVLMRGGCRSLPPTWQTASVVCTHRALRLSRRPSRRCCCAASGTAPLLICASRKKLHTGRFALGVAEHSVNYLFPQMR